MLVAGCGRPTTMVKDDKRRQRTEEQKCLKLQGALALHQPIEGEARVLQDLPPKKSVPSLAISSRSAQSGVSQLKSGHHKELQSPTVKAQVVMFNSLVVTMCIIASGEQQTRSSWSKKHKPSETVHHFTSSSKAQIFSLFRPTIYWLRLQRCA